MMMALSARVTRPARRVVTSRAGALPSLRARDATTATATAAAAGRGKPGARRKEQPGPVDEIRRHGVPREVPQPTLVPVKDVGRVEPLRNGEIDLRIDRLVDRRLDASLPRDQVPAVESPGRPEQGEEEKD